MKHLFGFAAAAVLVLPAIAPADTVVLDDDMTDPSRWVVRRTHDAGATFGYNFSAIAVTTAAAWPGNVIPPAPVTSSTVGLRLEANNNNFDIALLEARNANVTVWSTTEPATNNYDIEYTVYNAIQPNTTGSLWIPGGQSTELFGIAFQNDNVTSIAPSRVNIFNASNLVRDPVSNALYAASVWDSDTQALNNGFVFSYSPGLGIGSNTVANNNSNIILFNREATDGTKTIGDGFVGFYYAQGNSSPQGTYYFDHPDRLRIRNLGPTNPIPGNFWNPAVYPAGRIPNFENTNLSHIWNTIKVEVRGALVSIRVNGDLWVQVTSNKPGRRFGITTEDPFPSVVPNPDQQFNLVSRVKVTDVALVASASDWALFE